MTDVTGGKQSVMEPEEIQRRDEEREHAKDMGFGFCEECGHSYHYEPDRPHKCTVKKNA